jgi:hypothetical protein
MKKTRIRLTLGTLTTDCLRAGTNTLYTTNISVSSLTLETDRRGVQNFEFEHLDLQITTIESNVVPQY